MDWKLFKDKAPADCHLVEGSVNRVEEGLSQKLKVLVGDRGFDSQSNVTWLENRGIYNGICPRSPVLLRQRMREDRFAGLQNRRSQTEGRIGIFKNQFLGRPLRVKGFVHRELAVAWGVLTHNLWVIARLPKAKEQQQAA